MKILRKVFLYFICYKIERAMRRLQQRNRYVVNTLGRDNLFHLISVANALHCENPLRVEDDWIGYYKLEEADFDVTKVDPNLVDIIPTVLQIGKI